MDQYEQIQSYNKKFFLGVAVKLALIGAVFLGISTIAGLIWYYQDMDNRKISFEEAKKIGYWELMDDYYVFKSALKVNIFKDTVKNIEILDEKNGNEINILAMSKDFSDSYLKYDAGKSEDEKSNDELFMDFYAPDNYAVKGTGKIEDGNAEVNYNLIENKEYENLNDKISGFLGRINCSDNVMVILITNKADKFNRERAFDFVKRMSCNGGASDISARRRNENVSSISINDTSGSTVPAGAEEGGNISSTDTGNKISREEPNLPDADNTFESGDNDGDGLSNNVEFVVGSDPNKADTDSDGFSDFDEMKYGYNSQIPSPGDELAPGYYSKIKEQIKIMDEENYKKIFQQ